MFENRADPKQLSAFYSRKGYTLGNLAFENKKHYYRVTVFELSTNIVMNYAMNYA